MSPLHLTPTGDGSLTVHSDEYEQAMHTLSGAREESLLKHVMPSRVLERNEPVLHVLDVGFGIGYNVLVLLEEFRKNRKGRRLEVVSLEMEAPPMETLDAIDFPGPEGELYGIVKTLPRSGRIAGEGFILAMLTGDARNTIRQLPDAGFHAIFHDPYSPSKNPEMWTVEFFRELYRCAVENCVLTTYSSAPRVRRALLDAGFTVGRGPAVGPKREGTLASRGPVAEPLAEDEIAALRSTARGVPYRDPGLISTREEIIARRVDEMGLWI